MKSIINKNYLFCY